MGGVQPVRPGAAWRWPRNLIIICASSCFEEAKKLRRGKLPYFIGAWNGSEFAIAAFKINEIVPANLKRSSF
jgi:hypothetical protein